ncbi:phage tail protein [Pasteurella canis]|uniref:phage tail protein n=1 Tax=Pasteurella TaxID=745 RepID=UPI001CC39E5B|nr:MULTISPECIES: phage tail protein [Pasteurella]UAY77393.1 phage tail protein [Pasteurella canis]WRK07893.1 phage tail protein [Pasteurella multocida]HDX1124354.1 tail fiber protein [Pasteurella multocida]HDX1186313.1 tail fiber protein [Pasteurella multocida]
MYALDNDSGVQTMPEVKAKKFNHTEPRWFTEGGNGVAPSYPGADWFNIVQAELLNILTEANIAPDKSQLNQITLAIKEVVKNSVSKSVEGKANKTHKHPVSDITGLQDALDEAGKKGLPVGSIIGFDKAITPPGFLRCDGSTFSSATYPDLYRARKNNNVLPNLTRSDVGMTAYFAVDDIPDGWIYFDDIATQVTQSTYPELYQHLVRKYGSISAVPKAQDRFIRNAGNGLSVGQTQEDAIRNITGGVDANYGGKSVLYTEASGAFVAEDIGSNRYSFYTSNHMYRGKDIKFDASRVVPTADENRPKALVLKKCIKAKNNFDDVAFWIKAFGSVENEGQMDAANLAQDIQDIRHGKANKEHNHSYNEIVDFTSGVAAQFFYQKTENFEVFKYPDGSMIQIYKSNPILNHSNTSAGFMFNWAQAFTSIPALTWSVSSDQDAARDCWVTFNKSGTTNTKVKYWIFEGSYNTSNLEVNIIAIGKWK